MAETEQKTFERKPISLALCRHYDYWWNDPEQRNYTLHQCRNKENTGGITGSVNLEFHGTRTYSVWHENKGMKYRCWGKSEKKLECELAVAKTQPEVPCQRFVSEEAHPKEALVLKEEIRERFYETDTLCAMCQNCFEDE